MFENRFLNGIDKIYGLLIKVGNNLQSLFLLYMRVIWGHQLFLSGFNKFGHIDQVGQFFASIHIGFPLFSAYLVAIFEVLCGICIFFGFASRLMAIPMAIMMLTALSTAHASALANFKFIFEPTVLVREAPYPFLLTAFIVFIFGPGRISIDAWIKRSNQKWPKF